MSAIVGRDPMTLGPFLLHLVVVMLPALWVGLIVGVAAAHGPFWGSLVAAPLSGGSALLVNRYLLDAGASRAAATAGGTQNG